MRRIAIAAIIAFMALGAWLWYSSESTPPSVDMGQPLPGYEPAGKSEQESSQRSPFTVTGGQSEDANSSGLVRISPADSPPTNINVSSIADMPPVDVASVGREPITDSQYRELRDRLQNDPGLLQRFIDEFRQEQDPERLARLAQLLGDIGGEAVTLMASELIYSGDPAARKLGLSLLQRIQPGNENARNIASGLLATEIEPQVLVDTLTSLSQPGTVDEQSRNFLAGQVAFLTEHEDSAVRSISLNILSRWSTDDRYTTVLLNGLTDSEPVVREAAAYAMVGHEDSSEQVISTLMQVALDTEADKAVRNAVFLALRRMGISEQQRQQLLDAERIMNQVVRGTH